ncbi:hypothetical protein GMD78_04930 [Ornithinibacillus sp. L9]|uniref:Uncharacterized protein n=1 Tax=Ornithinibacillus caprae TaxID=2678566 RepID=A0A6N8FEA7_9BACI|nr:hypothetical protein [Ornithinibacillus caprae]MUK87745.1 hypothetical protein [Ornithinibacillus caprae]
MEQETILKEILHVLRSHSDQVNKRFKEMDDRFEKKFEQLDDKFERKFQQMDDKFEKRFVQMEQKFEKKFDHMDKRFDRLEQKVDGIRIDLTDTQKTTNFLLSKVAQHEEKLLQLSEQQT